MQCVHLWQEGRDVGCLMVGELVVLLEDGSRLGKESVVLFTFALSFCFAFLLFRLFGRPYSQRLSLFAHSVLLFLLRLSLTVLQPASWHDVFFMKDCVRPVTPLKVNPITQFCKFVWVGCCRMLSSLACLMCRGGCRFLVRMSLVLS